MDTLKLLRLHYTAGESIESIVHLYTDVVCCLEDWHMSYRAYIAHLAQESGDDLRTDGTPIHFGELEEFQLLLDILSLGILLGQGDALRRVAVLIERYRRDDMLVEYLLESAVPDPCTDVEKFFHVKPYDPLLDAVFTADTADESIEYMKKYLAVWYKAFDGAPWHNGHLVQTEEYSNYEGYWAFEAAAVCVLKGIDDAGFRDHLVYPKDLADWARQHRVTDAVRWHDSPSGAEILRCEAGQPCPREGWWQSPAASGQRQRFTQGQLMPDLGGAYGATVWQWDERQDP